MSSRADIVFFDCCDPSALVLVIDPPPIRVREGRNQVSDSWADAVLTRQVEAGAGAGLNNCHPPRVEWQVRNRLSFSGALGTGFQVQDS